MRLFGTKRALCLALLFWYTGYNQPYQLNGFGDRFFRKRVVGLQLASFYFMEVVGGFVAGRALDDKSRSHRRSAVVVLCQFVAVTAVGFGVAGYLEDRGPGPGQARAHGRLLRRGHGAACLELPRDAKLVAADAPLLANEAPGSLQ
ncbi:G-protein coupled peptide receptor [Aureococcus anophagefferens]|nr:G-protein coupled peptide receptor [Aureococcus anophagefferens]